MRRCRTCRTSIADKPAFHEYCARCYAARVRDQEIEEAYKRGLRDGRRQERRRLRAPPLVEDGDL